jgi:hypothetical protein
MNEDVLYLEADEEITAAINKLVAVKGSSVKIVVPKRSTLLQSIVNLKLLKKAAIDAHKQLVLVTNDRTSTHLAGRVGLPVAATLKSTPATPVVAPQSDMASDVIEAEEVAPNPLESDKPKPVSGPKPSYAKPMVVRTPVGEASAEAATASKIKKPRVPDFGSLQRKLMLGGGVIALLILLYVINIFITQANVTLYAKGAQIKAAFTFTVDPSLSKTDASKLVLAGKALKSDKSVTTAATATGTKDVGTKASGSVSIQNCEDTNAHGFPAGSTVTASGKSFATTESVTIPSGSFSGGGQNCTSAAVSVAVTATQAGDSYNLASGTKYASPSLTANYKITGSQMSGGTSKTVTVLTQADVDKARDDAVTKDKDTAQKDLENKAGNDQKAITESFTATAGDVTSSIAVGSEASSSTVTVKISYSELAVNKTEYEDLVKAQEQKQVSDQNQIYDTGVDNAKLTAKPVDAGGRQAFDFAADAYGGAKVDIAEVAKQIKGKRYGDAADIAAKVTGVEKAEISITPGWSTKIPNMTSHIHITLKVAPKS